MSGTKIGSLLLCLVFPLSSQEVRPNEGGVQLGVQVRLHPEGEPPPSVVQAECMGMEPGAVPRVEGRAERKIEDWSWLVRIAVSLSFQGEPKKREMVEMKPKFVAQLGHSSGLNSAVFSPDGRQVLTASDVQMCGLTSGLKLSHLR